MKINCLEAGRGIAATAVVFHHAGASVSAFFGHMPVFLTALFSFGYLGVDFFFVLSGFIIYYSSFGKDANPRRFAVGRIKRIFVPYLPVGIAIAVIYTLLPALSASDREWGWWATLTLLPSWQAPALSVAWTLQHELVFYMIFALLLSFNRICAGLILWSLSIVLIAVLDVDVPRPMQFLFSLINLEFNMGVLAAHVFISGIRIPFLALVASAPIAAFFALGADREYSVFFGMGLAGFILLMAQSELKGRLRVPRVLVFVGAASYSIYLIHNPLLSITSRISTGWLSGLIFGVVASLLLGIAYYLIWEKGTQRIFGRAQINREA